MSQGTERRGFAFKGACAIFVALATWTCLFASAASAAPTPAGTLNAESMTLPRGASSVKDRSADGGRAAQFTRNGTATASITTTATVTSLTLAALGTQCSKSWPQLQLTIDGTSVLNTVIGTTGYTAYPASPLSVPAGPHTVALIVSNLQSSDRCSRTLSVDILRLFGDGTTPPTPPIPPTPPTPPTPPSTTCQSIIVPGYFYPSPTTLWDSASSTSGAVSYIVANPANGPGTALDGAYASAIARAQAAGVRVMGYVHTSYGQRSLTAVKADIATWKQFYGVTDIFFDEASDSSQYLSYYQGLADVVHATPGAKTMFNPGTNVDQGYMAMADIVNIFEGTASDLARFSPASWVASYPKSRFSYLVYGVTSSSSMTTLLTQTAAMHAGYVYITNDILPNPWDTLPSYWTTEVSQVNQGCAATAG
jgi:Spherulation-specific family 4